jgi:PTS system cellobiose-specific IIA component
MPNKTCEEIDTDGMTEMQIILHAGDARSKCLMALQKINEENIEEARKLLSEANAEINLAHKVQTEMIQEEAKGNKKEVSLLMVHAQDHLMTAIAIRDMVITFIAYASMMEKKISKLEERK